MNTRDFPEYAAIEGHIRKARIERVAYLSRAIAGFVMAIVNELKAPPAAPAIVIDRRRESRSGVSRMTNRFAPR